METEPTTILMCRRRRPPGIAGAGRGGTARFRDRMAGLTKFLVGSGLAADPAIKE